MWKLEFSLLLLLSYKITFLEEWLLLLQFPLWNIVKNGLGIYEFETKFVFPVSWLSLCCLKGSKCVREGKWSGSQPEHSAGKLILLVWVPGGGNWNPAVFAHTFSGSAFPEPHRAGSCFVLAEKISRDSPFSEGRALIYWFILDDKLDRKRLRGVSKDEKSLSWYCPS